MRATLAAAALALGLAGAVAAQDKTLLVLGDSLSAEYGLPRGSGWVALLGDKLGKNGFDYRVVNASISGETTSGGAARLPALLKEHRPAVVVLELGGNDALRGLQLAATEQNLRKMAREAKAIEANVLVVGMQVPPNYGKAYAQRFGAMFKRVADQEKAALVPFLLEGFGERMEWFQADRIHPTVQAQPRMLENVWPELSKLLEARKQ
jgi:acyl-CoA thioesterase-1